MKQIKFITTALICGTIALSSCDKQNGDGYIDNAVYEAFSSGTAAVQETTQTSLRGSRKRLQHS